MQQQSTEIVNYSHFSKVNIVTNNFSKKEDFLKRPISTGKHAWGDLSLIFLILEIFILYDKCAERRMRHMLATPCAAPPTAGP